MKRDRYTPGLGIIELLMIALAVLFFFPLYMTFINGFKTYNEVVTSTVALPHIFQFKNFAVVWKQINFLGVFMNSLIVTVVSVAGILLISSVAAYQLVRRPGPVSQIIFLAILSSLVIPFQTMMIPLVKVAQELHLINTLYGIIMMYWGFGIPLALFLYHGFIKSIPRELEEAAHIDGSGTFGVYFRILFAAAQADHHNDRDSALALDLERFSAAADHAQLQAEPDDSARFLRLLRAVYERVASGDGGAHDGRRPDHPLLSADAAVHHSRDHGRRRERISIRS
ncbi:carbohydrate ABC transporter permease [Paenibacillus sp. P26]|nr:carbohydrate ABC transporter permease [Paenibacillus sp. P26]